MAEVRRNGRRLDAPLRIRLGRASGATEVSCQELYRVLPGKRVVVRATLDDRVVVLKLFLGNGAPRYRQREARGIAAMARCGVQVPSLIDGGRLEGGAGEWLAFDFIADARPLTEADLADNATCATVLQTLAQLHAGGVVHHDLHLGNFLLTRRHDLYAIDGDAVRAIGTGALSHRHSLDNLALFVAQFPPRDNHRISRACRVYAMARGWPDEKMDPDDLEDRIAKARGDRVRRYLKKSLRECTEFHAERSSTSFIVADRAALANGLDEVLRYLTTAVDDSPKLKI
jgi:hypothetical protein